MALPVFAPAQAVLARVIAAVQTDAASCAPREACGLLVGYPGGLIVQAVALTNMHHQPEQAFALNPADQFAAARAARAQGFHVVGVYHSHPNGSLTPSQADGHFASEPNQVWLIVNGADWSCWRTTGGGFDAHPLRLIDGWDNEETSRGDR
jgi:proteasome lid subunit RPN8/RPN11